LIQSELAERWTTPRLHSNYSNEEKGDKALGALANVEAIGDPISLMRIRKNECRLAPRRRD
jgi:hypothetical protein